MRFNPDCLRGVLMTVEKQSTFSEYCTMSCNRYAYYDEFLSDFSIEEIMYHVRFCFLAGYLYDPSDSYGFTDRYFCDVSPEGHEFLNKVRSEENWIKTKETAGKIGSTSLNILTEIAAKILSNLIEHQLG